MDVLSAKIRNNRPGSKPFGGPEALLSALKDEYPFIEQVLEGVIVSGRRDGGCGRENLYRELSALMIS